MDKKFLFLLLPFLLLAILIVISIKIKPPFVSIENITEKNIDEKITTQIIVNKIYSKEGFAAINIKNSNISIIFFDTNKINITQNNTLEIQGKVSQYKNELEIIVDKIKCLKC